MSKIHLVTGDLTNYPEADAVVNAANEKLLGGEGVCGALFRKAGWERMQESCNEFPADEDGVRCPTGKAVLTSAHDLPNLAVIHAVGPVYNPIHGILNRKALAGTYFSALSIAEQHGFKHVAFPAISCGIFGYPLWEAAPVSLAAIRDALSQFLSIKRVDMVFLPFGDGPDVKAAFEDSLSKQF